MAMALRRDGRARREELRLFDSPLQIRGFEPYVAPDARSRKRAVGTLGLKKIIKLASNENALGPSAASALAAMRKVGKKLYLYPDGAGSVSLRMALRRRK